MIEAVSLAAYLCIIGADPSVCDRIEAYIYPERLPGFGACEAVKKQWIDELIKAARESGLNVRSSGSTCTTAHLGEH